MFAIFFEICFSKILRSITNVITFAKNFKLYISCYIFIKSSRYFLLPTQVLHNQNSPASRVETVNLWTKQEEPIYLPTISNHFKIWNELFKWRIMLFSQFSQLNIRKWHGRMCCVEESIWWNCHGGLGLCRLLIVE